MRVRDRIATDASFTVADLRIVEPRTAWSAPEAGAGYRMVFIRRGAFRLRIPGWEGLADPATAYLGRPGDEQSIAHRPGREDVCTEVGLDAAFARELRLDQTPTHPVLTSGRLDLAHRALVARARRGADGFELAERIVWLAAELPRRADRRAGPAEMAPFRRRVVESARELLTADPAWTGLDTLARRVGVSRSYLSRTFRSHTGETLTRFRNGLRLRAALDRIEAGETDLAGLAADLGFADHAHLSRAMRAEVGHPPSRVRALLSR
ncbi:helix-turn-helix domain-containing protein [Pseudonocardia acaciae]|uniref:helix-turn-helix domain-containing protein n=1 Tax=Pseudonocardia acaciae TaxID=551276 RepID=UPI0006875471|nr:AraC family transcriptional regulator [Pseudonocardia acaciae]